MIEGEFIKIDDPIPDKLLFLTQEKKRYKVVKGGRGSTKSQSIARSLIDRASKKPLQILCTREYQNSIKDSVHKLLCRIIRLKNLNNPLLRNAFKLYETKITNANGSEFLFSGLQNIDSLKSIDEIDICWIAEASSVTLDHFKKLTPSIRKEGSEIWIDFNPESEEDPVYARFCQYVDSEGEKQDMPDSYESKNVILETINWDENPFFPDVLEIERQECLRTMPDEYDHIWGGELNVKSEALIFKDKYEVKEFDYPDINYVEYQRYLQGADFGYTKDPSVLIRAFIKKEGIKTNLYICNEAYGHKIEINGLSLLYNEIDDVKDWTIKGDCSEPATISYLAQDYDEETGEKGFDIVSCKKFPGSVQAGINFLRSFDKIYIHPRCIETAKEFRLYAYKVDKKTGKIAKKVGADGKSKYIILDKNNHCLDGVRYLLDDYIEDSVSQDIVYDETDNTNDLDSKYNW